jgi:hypothetical protein
MRRSRRYLGERRWRSGADRNFANIEGSTRSCNGFAALGPASHRLKCFETSCARAGERINARSASATSSLQCCPGAKQCPKRDRARLPCPTSPLLLPQARIHVRLLQLTPYELRSPLLALVRWEALCSGASSALNRQWTRPDGSNYRRCTRRRLGWQHCGTRRAQSNQLQREVGRQ